MSTRNRERRIANRELRTAAEEAHRRRVRRQRWVFGIGGLLVAVAVAVVLVVKPFEDDDDDVEAADATTTTTSIPVEGSVLDEPCVARVDPLPEGAPEVPVAVGPPPTELVIEDLVVGTGADVTAESSVTVHYIGVACSSGKVFDSSYSRNETFPLEYVPASGGWQVIPGWNEGIPGMKVGGQRLLGIPPSLAYGPVAQGDAIAPDETLWFVVEAVEVTAPAEPTPETPEAATPTS